MARTVTPSAVKRIITKGLTGWEAGKLVLQDLVNSYYHMDSILTDSDIATLRNASMDSADIRDYNMFMALCRGFHMECILGEWTCADAGLQISFLDHILQDARRRRTVELFESCGPRVVTRKQYDDIVSAQKQRKLAFEYNLGYVIEERFYAIAPPEAKEEIEDICPDIESAEDFASAVPGTYKDLLKQAVDEIRSLYISGKLPATFHKEDEKKAEPLLAKWKRKRLSTQDTMKLVDMLFIKGQQLYDCGELPEWKDYMDSYSQYICGDEDERFRHAYAVMEECTVVWLTENRYYKGPPKPSEFITRSTELLLGLINEDDKPKKSIQAVGDKLRNRLDTAELNIRLFFATKAILDAAAEAVELDIPGKGGLLAFPYMRVGAFIDLYNIRLENLREKRKPWESGETRLEKALKTLPAIDPEKLKPSADSLKQLKEDIMKDARGEEWLRIKVRSLEYDDGFTFSELVKE